MALKQVLEMYDFLERPSIHINEVKKLFVERGLKPSEFESRRVKGAKGETQFVKIYLKGKDGRSERKLAPRLGIIGRLGGVGARPHKIGLVSDADGAITTEVAVPGCATGVSHAVDIELAVRFSVEVAKAFTEGKCSFYDQKEYARILARYGSMEHLKTKEYGFFLRNSMCLRVSRR